MFNLSVKVSCLKTSLFTRYSVNYISCPKSTRKVSGLSRNASLGRIDDSRARKEAKEPLLIHVDIISFAFDISARINLYSSLEFGNKFNVQGAIWQGER